MISAWLQRIGKEPVFVDGLRQQLDVKTLDVAVMALAGKVNTDLVAVLQPGGTPAIGLSGVDGGSSAPGARPARTSASSARWSTSTLPP